MSLRLSLSVLSAAAALAFAGCSIHPAGQASQESPIVPVPATAEPLKERLANQARAIIELSAANDKLLARVEELKKEVARLEAQLKAQGAPAAAPTPATSPAPAPTPAPTPVPPPAEKKN